MSQDVPVLHSADFENPTEQVQKTKRDLLTLRFKGFSTTDLIREVISRIGDNPFREGLEETPVRVRDSWVEIFGGYNADVKHVLKTFSSEGFDEMVVVRDISFTSFCEHHMLPFTGMAHVGYLPGNGRIVGLSKLPRLVQVFARRLQVQERITVQVVQAMNEHLKPQGAGCVIEATHACMGCRGVRQPQAVTVTSSLVGAFKTDPTTRAEFLDLARSKK